MIKMMGGLDDEMLYSYVRGRDNYVLSIFQKTPI
jgi:hypothetical protein